MSADETAKSRKRLTIKTAGALWMATAEAFVLAEILWYYLHDGEQTLHSAFREWVERKRDHRRTTMADVTAFHDDTLDEIRDLPETEDVA